jgi:hypothetical protein
MSVQRLFLTCPDCKACIPAVSSTRIEYPEVKDLRGLIRYKRIIIGDCPWCRLTVVGNKEDMELRSPSGKIVAHGQPSVQSSA